MLTGDIAQALSARIEGDKSIDVDRLVHPARAERPSDLALAMSGDAVTALSRSKAQAVVVSDARPAPAGFKAVIAIGDPRMTLAKLTALFDRGPNLSDGVHPTAVVAPDAVLGEGVRIGAFVAIGPRSRIGAGTRILPHATVGGDVVIGANGLVHSGVRIGHQVIIGDRVIIHANAVIGADGFSYAPDLNSPIGFTPDVKVTRIHSLGNVEIEDDVEIGACTAIDRSTLETTRIGRGTKIDNLVHIGHNVVIGESCILAGMVGVSGSVTIGNRVRIGGGVGISDHVKISDEAVIGGGSGVGGNVDRGAFMLGYPAVPRERALEQFVYMSRQKRLHQKVDDMASRLDALEQTIKK